MGTSLGDTAIPGPGEFQHWLSAVCRWVPTPIPHQDQGCVEWTCCAHALPILSIQNLGLGHSGSRASKRVNGMTQIKGHLNKCFGGHSVLVTVVGMTKRGGAGKEKA